MHIISKAKGFSFIHIPKNGGSTFKETFRQFHDQGDVLNTLVTDHPIVGRVSTAHLPLTAIRDHFEAEFDTIRNTTSFALTRDPVERFVSSMAQRLRQFRGKDLRSISRDDFESEFDMVTDHLKDYPDRPLWDFVHFTRQVNYIYLEGAQFVDRVFSIEHLAQPFCEIGVLAGYHAPSVHRNRSDLPTSQSLNMIAGRLWKAGKSLIPKRYHSSVKNKAIRFLAVPGSRYGATFLDEHHIQFVNEFYKDDFDLHFEAQKSETQGMQKSSQLQKPSN